MLDDARIPGLKSTLEVLGLREFTGWGDSEEWFEGTDELDGPPGLSEASLDVLICGMGSEGAPLVPALVGRDIGVRMQQLEKRKDGGELRKRRRSEIITDGERK